MSLAIDSSSGKWLDFKQELKQFYAKSKKPHDDYVSKIVRAILTKPLAFLFVKYTKITPNQVTVMSIIPGILGIIFLSLGRENAIIGAILVFLYGLLDGVDGIMSRATGLHSKMGQWLDGAAGYVLIPFVILSAAIGLRSYSALLIGSIAALCFPLQFVLIHYFKSEIVESNERIKISSSGKFEFLKYIYGVALFYYLLLFGAFFDKMIYVLWFLAVFGNLFWMGTLVLQYLILRKDTIIKK